MVSIAAPRWRVGWDALDGEAARELARICYLLSRMVATVETARPKAFAI